MADDVRRQFNLSPELQQIINSLSPAGQKGSFNESVNNTLGEAFADPFGRDLLGGEGGNRVGLPQIQQILEGAGSFGGGLFNEGGQNRGLIDRILGNAGSPGTAPVSGGDFSVGGFTPEFQQRLDALAAQDPARSGFGDRLRTSFNEALSDPTFGREFGSQFGESGPLTVGDDFLKALGGSADRFGQGLFAETGENRGLLDFALRLHGLEKLRELRKH